LAVEILGRRWLGVVLCVTFLQCFVVISMNNKKYVLSKFDICYFVKYEIASRPKSESLLLHLMTKMHSEYVQDHLKLWTPSGDHLVDKLLRRNCNSNVGKISQTYSAVSMKRRIANQAMDLVKMWRNRPTFLLKPKRDRRIGNL